MGLQPLLPWQLVQQLLLFGGHWQVWDSKLLSLRLNQNNSNIMLIVNVETQLDG